MRGEDPNKKEVEVDTDSMADIIEEEDDETWEKGKDDTQEIFSLKDYNIILSASELIHVRDGYDSLVLHMNVFVSINSSCIVHFFHSLDFLFKD